MMQYGTKNNGRTTLIQRNEKNLKHHLPLNIPEGTLKELPEIRYLKVLSSETRLNRQNFVPGMSSRRERVNRVRTIKGELTAVSCRANSPHSLSLSLSFWSVVALSGSSSETWQGRRFHGLILISARKHATVSGN